jgi:hypothetical protein
VAGAVVDYYPLYANPNVDKLPGAWHPRSAATTGADGSYALTVLPGQGVIGVAGPTPHLYMPAHTSHEELKAFFKEPVSLLPQYQGMLWALGGNLFDGMPPSAWNAAVLLEPGEKEQGLVKDLALERPLERKGRVVGPDGKPLAGAMVFGLTPREHGAKTLEGSEFTVRGINPRAPRHLLFFHKEKNLGLFLKELPGEKDGPVTVKLEACGAVTGRMVDRDGQPVAKMHLDFAATAEWGSVGAPRQAVTTDKDGRFRAEGLVPGYRYTFSGLAPGVKYEQSPGLWSVVVRPEEKKDMGDLQAERKR